MSGIKFINGTWSVSKDQRKKNEHGALSIDIDFSENFCHCISVWCYDDVANKQEEEIARLVALAPEMLRFIKRVAKGQNGELKGEFISSVKKQAANLLTKAQGGHQ